MFFTTVFIKTRKNNTFFTYDYDCFRIDNYCPFRTLITFKPIDSTTQTRAAIRSVARIASPLIIAYGRHRRRGMYAASKEITWKRTRDKTRKIGVGLVQTINGSSDTSCTPKFAAYSEEVTRKTSPNEKIFIKPRESQVNAIVARKPPIHSIYLSTSFSPCYQLLLGLCSTFRWQRKWNKTQHSMIGYTN